MDRHFQTLALGHPSPDRMKPAGCRLTDWCRACPGGGRGTAGSQRNLDLPRQLRKLDNFDFLLLDDLGYLPQGAEESEVLFTLIAERYERRSLGITSNLVFSQWEHIFANQWPRPWVSTKWSTTRSSWNSTSPATAPEWPSSVARIRR